ncbi:acetyltransferase [Nostoc linckia z18]|jgi:8-oxo-dGTP diphosphatase|uniref:Acetyltransferase n=2 Tax=Nostoc linckia TaxID=92942 RepID=A0A9Q6EKT8_NOSLI|nr:MULTISPECIES: NUDIX domain-containing protein [Nostoc]MDZ8012133.1 NUDIX domain-containing protein [Nostoc sp. ZfuVER08]PHK35592.1 acetyltransferase [Nostoc linckia z15]PHK47951.1 acetyltransferase [Nostoc linckia z16]MBC1237312.1 NUDIX domain-containing protein [Nostoc sp. 2RC]PHJ62289.1 acetyltransferase [Nostoc linckia z1]
MREPPGADIIIINSQQKVLLVLRDNKSSIPFPNTWALLGGFIEENESPEATIRRELVEEMELELGEIKFFKSYFWQECDEHIFWTRLDLDISQITLHEGQKLAYFSREEINQLEFASHYDRILVDFYDFLGKNLELSIG